MGGDGMTKLYYKIVPTGFLTECITSCQHRQNIMIGSGTCKECQYHMFEGKDYVVCTHNSILNRIRRMFK